MKHVNRSRTTRVSDRVGRRNIGWIDRESLINYRRARGTALIAFSSNETAERWSWLRLPVGGGALTPRLKLRINLRVSRTCSTGYFHSRAGGDKLAGLRSNKSPAGKNEIVLDGNRIERRKKKGERRGCDEFLHADITSATKFVVICLCVLEFESL